MNTIDQQLQVAREHKAAGRLDDAKRLCERILTLHSEHADTLQLAGAIYYLQGDHDLAISHLERAVAIQPSNAQYWITLGANLATVGQMSRAEHCFRQATAADPSSAEAHINLGLALKHQGEYMRAEASFKSALSISPNSVVALGNLGFVLIQLGKIAEAKAALEGALAIMPQHAPSITCYASICLLEGKADVGEALLLKAKGLQPGHFPTHTELAAFYFQDGKLEMGIEIMEEVVSAYPQSAEAATALAMFLFTTRQFDRAISAAKSAIAINRNLAGAWRALGVSYAEMGLFEEAQQALAMAIGIQPTFGLRVQHDLLLPSIMGTLTEVAASRTLFEQRIDRLLQESDVKVDEPFSSIGYTNFFVAFHGQDDKSLQHKISSLYAQVAPSLLFRSPHCGRGLTQASGKKIKVGFYSRFTFTHSVSLSFGSIIDALAKDVDIDVVLISDTEFSRQDVQSMYASFTGKALRVPRQLNSARTQIAAEELDVLVYLDIGMDPFTYLLAHARLARVQCVMGGHPVTTGIRNMDYFLSPALAEPADGEAHYTEKLVRLEYGGFYFERPTLPSSKKTRSMLGLPEAGNIYLCPMMLQKIHPDFDAAVEQILTLDPTGKVIFFESITYPAWARLLGKRFDKTISSSLRDRIIFMPWITDKNDFMLVNEAASVVLDPFHFGIGTTGIAVIGVGTPFVTLPGKFMRGRVGFAYCQMLDLPECIATDARDYAIKAVQIASDSALRESIKAKIIKNSRNVFENDQAAPEVAKVLKMLAFKQLDSLNQT